MSDGKISLTWLGQMGLLIKTDSTSLCVDYFASPMEGRLVAPPVPAGGLKGIDAFVGTHNHIDHIDHDAWKIWAKNKPDAKFIFPRKHMESVLKDGIAKENAIGLNDGESYQTGDVTIHAIPEAGGIRIHHAGDTVRYEGMLGKIKQFGKIDVQLLPINGRDAKRYRQNWIGNMTYQEAADLAGDVMPSLVIPGHWDMFEINGEDPVLFADYIDAKYGKKTECRIPKIMEEIIIEKRNGNG